MKEIAKTAFLPKENLPETDVAEKAYNSLLPLSDVQSIFMKKLPNYCIYGAVLLSLFSLASCVSSSDAPDVTIAGDRTSAGENFRMPTAAVPYYYYLVSIGPQEWGPAVAGEEPPPPRDVVEPLIVETLANQHYIRATRETPMPSLVIGYAWGTANVDEIDFGGEDEEGNPIGPQQVNRKQMLSLVATRHTDTSPNSIDMNLAVPPLDEGRHFILIAAYDINAFPKKGEVSNDEDKKARKRPKPLWRMRLSTPNRHTTLTQALPVMLESGREFIGQDQMLPETVSGRVRSGTVTIGEMTVKSEGDASEEAAPSDASEQAQQAPSEK